MRTSASVDTNNKNGCIKAAWVYKKVQQRLLRLRLRGYGRMPYPPNKRGAVETTAPPGDSGGIQTHDLQSFFSTKSLCSKNKKVQQTAETMAAWVWQGCHTLLRTLHQSSAGCVGMAGCHTLLIKEVQLRQLHPLVIPVGFKPTTFRTFSRPSLAALKIKNVQPRKAAPPW